MSKQKRERRELLTRRKEQQKFSNKPVLYDRRKPNSDRRKSQSVGY